jgi:D-alanyl-D-alanine carboxypeptidase
VPFVSTFRVSSLIAAMAVATLTTLVPSHASAEALLLIEADSGKVLHAENATYPWHPASLSKLMTAYVTLQAVKAGRITLDSPFTVSARAASQAPSKMGFKAGTIVTMDNAMKMLMVKSANDMAVVLAEGVGGSVEQFADEMNATARRLGMTESSWVNPNGLPDDRQISSARDLAILARALIKDFPEYDMYWHLPGLRLGKRIIKTYNSMIGRYPGADGMKTGFICASGFNLVATATRRGRRLIAVVLGAPSGPVRAVKAAMLLERGFNSGAPAWFAPSLGTVDSLQAMNVAPPDLHDEMCGPHRKRPAAEEVDEDPSASSSPGDPSSPQAFMLSSLPPGGTKPSKLLGPPVALTAARAVEVYVGPARHPAAAEIAIARARLDGKMAKNADPVLPTVVANAAPARAAPGQIAAAATIAPARPAAPGQIAAPAPVVALANTAAASSANPPVPAGRFPAPRHRALPAVSDSGAAPWMSFASSAQAEPAPLMVAPPVATAPQVATMLMPRPRPRLEAHKR